MSVFPCLFASKGSVIIYSGGGGGGGWHRREMFFLIGKKFSDPTIKKPKKILANLKYQLKNKYLALANNFTKGYHSVVTNVLYRQYHFCDMSLTTRLVQFSAV